MESEEMTDKKPQFDISFSVLTGSHADGKIVQETHLMRDGIVEQVTRRVVETHDQQIRDALIELGWTPPQTAPCLFPEHKCSLYLNHNDHKNIYESAAQWIADNDWCDWENEEAKQRAIETDEIWTLQWYPNTPVGFNALAAPTLNELLTLANKPQLE